jgi:C4-dicarboxylate transporter DctQ subunit
MLRVWDTLERWIVGVLGAFALLLSVWQIVGRYISRDLAMPWAEELAVYVIIWAALLTASQLVRNDGHVRADIIVRLLRPERQRALEIVNCILAVVFCAALAWYGWLATLDAWEIGEKSMTALAFPMWLYYAALPVAAALMTVRYAIRLFEWSFRFDPRTMAVQSGRES